MALKGGNRSKGGRKEGGRGARPSPTPSDRESAPDPTDIRIVQELLQDGRISINELAERVNVSRTNAYARVARLKREGVIEAFTVRLNPKKVGLPVAALVAVNIEQNEWRPIRDELDTFTEVEYYAFTTGQFDLILIVRAPDNETLRDVVLERLSGIEGVRTTTTFFILDDVAPRPTLAL